MALWSALLIAAASLSVSHAKLGETDRGLTSVDASWETITEKACEGTETESSQCPDQKECSPCVPLDCTLGEWSPWSVPSPDSMTNGKLKCLSLCHRTRKQNQSNSDCGEPCKGELTQTKQCTDDISCYEIPFDSAMSAWSAWSTCSKPTSQTTRSRKVDSEARNGGLAFTGPLTESLSCKSYIPRNCSFAPWSAWSACSATCNGGIITRVRKIAEHADRFGINCKGQQEQEDKCNTAPCPTKSNCTLGEWGAWSKCQSPVAANKLKSDSFGQQTRERSQVIAVAGGNACNDGVQETQGCKIAAPLPVDCTLSLWSVWSPCSKTCDGGQRHRDRKILNASIYGGSCPNANLKETALCSVQRCGVPLNDCKLKEWTAWSACPVTCGKGLQKRNRSTIEALVGGYPCKSTTLSEVRSCDNPDCKVKDCVWGPYGAWSNCSKPCGGTGRQHRFRALAAQPEHGGECEAKALEEGRQCNTQACPTLCANGTWGVWSVWTPCSASCGRGYTSRTRTPATAPNDCGFPALGGTDEFAECVLNKPGCKTYPDLDCSVSAWSPWTPCNQTCRGVHSRQRVIMVYAHGKGKSCGHSKLTETRTCAWNASCPSDVDCGFSDWKVISPCSATCGGGYLEKVRTIVPQKERGVACQGGLTSVDECNTQECPNSQCVDCSLGSWSEWDICTSWKGQRARRRSILETGNRCGRKCSDETLTETTDCNALGLRPDFVYCAWAAWSSWDKCGGSSGASESGCTWGPQANSRTRVLTRGVGKPDSYLVEAQVGDAIVCDGRQSERRACAVCTKCSPKDCEFSTWGEWESGVNIALCQRSRSIKSNNNECGKGCNGKLIETKECPMVVVPVNCLVGGWTHWSTCTSHHGQRERMRDLERVPSNGGMCDASIQETEPCNPLWLAPQNCGTSDWSRWSDCTASCHGGTQQRMRSIHEEAIAPGKPCDVGLREVRQCNAGDCKGDIPSQSDCAFQVWGQWSVSCTGRNQRFHSRPLLGGEIDGKACVGPVQETKACASGAVDCGISEWSDWGRCDTVCGVGMKERYRQVHKYPEKYGDKCPTPPRQSYTSLVDLAPCNEDRPCEAEKDCVPASWSEWTICTTSCGVGQQMRARDFVSKMTLLGKPCNNSMSEARPCLKMTPTGPRPSCYADCFWGQWSTWGGCSRKCGNGTQTRYRSIGSPPTPNGGSCAQHDMEEVKGCNPQACKEECTDGQWAPWSGWSECSATCAGGFTWQSRKVAVEASRCGVPVGGLSQRVKPCNEGIICAVDIDCELGTWTSWGLCSSSCNGLSERERHIKVHPAGAGSQCTGALKQVKPCQRADVPAACTDLPPPCVMSEWTPFSACTASCGTGQSTRTRAIMQHAACSGGLVETVGCKTAVCNKAVDCKWGHWSEWGKCDVCGGERHRTRAALSAGAYGGKLCEQENSAEVERCPRNCRGTYFCAWAGWSVWSSCSKSCGTSARRTRTRKLQLVNSSTPTISQLYEDDNFEARLEDRVSELYRKNQKVEAQRVQHLAIAFFAGCLSLALVFAVVAPYRRQGVTRTFSRIMELNVDGGAQTSLVGSGGPLAAV